MVVVCLKCWCLNLGTSDVNNNNNNNHYSEVSPYNSTLSTEVFDLPQIPVPVEEMNADNPAVERTLVETTDRVTPEPPVSQPHVQTECPIPPGTCLGR